MAKGVVMGVTRDLGQTALSRRQFISGSARLALGASLGLGFLSSAACGPGSNSSSASGPSPAAWRDLAQRISGQVLRPGDPGYPAAAMPNNLRYAAILPQGIAQCQSANDVAQAILWSREHRIPLRARSGGHSYAGYSTTRGLMIGLTAINQTSFDSVSGVITMGGGILNQALYAALQQANVGITNGRCPGVGGAAFVLGGGIGFDMRANGIASDSLAETNLVTADGQILTVNATQNPDLFWACQGGGGGNFGINTSLSLQTFPVPASVTAFAISWNTEIDSLSLALVEALTNAPSTLGSRLQFNAVTAKQLASGQDVTIDLLGQLQGSPSELAAILAPVYAVAQPTNSDIEVLSYWDAQLNFLEEPGPPSYYQERSRFFGELGSEPIATALRWLRKWPGDSKGADMVLFQTGGQMNTVAPDATAFVHRDSAWLMSIALSWSNTDSESALARNHEWQNEYYAAMLPFTTQGAYQNFSDPSLTDFLQAYYGANLPRLKQIKAQIDPTRVFNFPEAIPPAAKIDAEQEASATNRVAEHPHRRGFSTGLAAGAA
jgi:FAD/FMN-containing dehydrogenase